MVYKQSTELSTAKKFAVYSHVEINPGNVLIFQEEI